MKQVTITRYEHDDTGTYGDLSTGTFQCYTLERPSEGDHPCIPAGNYKCIWLNHPEHGWCYEVTGVPGRTAILIHSANWYQQLLGCIAPGRSVQTVDGYWKDQHIIQKGVTSSKDALSGLVADLEQKPFQLTIGWA